MNPITLTQELVEGIFQYLIKKPYEEVAHLITPLQVQAAPQIKIPESVSTVETTDPATPAP